MRSAPDQVHAGALILCLITLAYLHGATAAELTGAFGYELGAIYNSDSADAPPTETSYSVVPKEPNTTFNEYKLEVTPISRRISKIWGYGEIEEDKCFETRDAIAALLRKKYSLKDKELAAVMREGPPDAQAAAPYVGKFNLNKNIVILDGGVKKRVILYCLPDKLIAIQYQDLALLERVPNEKAELKLQDERGL